MYTMSTFEDWRTNLAQLLQSVPFPDKALTNDKFIKYIYIYGINRVPVIQNSYTPYFVMSNKFDFLE